MAENNLNITVIVPVYNGAHFLDRCLDGLFSSNHAHFEIVVVDDGSTDNSAELARNKGARVLEMAENSGPAGARNHAAGEVGGDILLFVDADVVVNPFTLSEIAALFDKDPDIAALFGSYDDEPAEPNFLSQYRNLLHHFVHQNSNREASTFWAGLGAIRREVFLEIDGFDCERFPIPSIEDIELGARLRKNGHRIILASEIQVKHLKKWNAVSILKTDIFCRAYPWSKLMLTTRGLINDLNLKTQDRVSAFLVGLLVAIMVFVFWFPHLLALAGVILIALVYLNRTLLNFLLKKKGFAFAFFAFPWQLLYFFYSGVIFVMCWFFFAFPARLGLRRLE